MKSIGVMIAVLLVAVAAIAAPEWYQCAVAWAGAGGGGVYLVLVNPAFPTLLGDAFPEHSVMVSGGSQATQANRFLAIALAAMMSKQQVAVYVEPLSFSEVGGIYMIVPTHD